MNTRRYDSSPANIYLFKVNKRNTRKRYEICSKLTIKTPERPHWRRSGVFSFNVFNVSWKIVNFELLLMLDVYLEDKGTQDNTLHYISYQVCSKLAIRSSYHKSVNFCKNQAEPCTNDLKLNMKN